MNGREAMASASNGAPVRGNNLREGPSLMERTALRGPVFHPALTSTFPFASSRRIPSHELTPSGQRRSALVVTGDGPLRSAVAEAFASSRWEVRTAASAAEMLFLVDAEAPAVCLLDSWLPDLQVRECVRELGAQYPGVDVIALDGSDIGALPPSKSPFRAEALHALREAQERLDAPVWKSSLSAGEILRRYDEQPTRAREVARSASGSDGRECGAVQPCTHQTATEGDAARQNLLSPAVAVTNAFKELPKPAASSATGTLATLPEFIGTDAHMREVSRRIQLVAPRKTAVLIHGPSGTGKELVARALHRLSGRARAPMVAINCAAIPEALIEAELFGHARGAFTGATHSRVGRIEAAAGGTLFLDEVGELPLTVQGKLLRFLESGELQRVGENETVRVDARVVAATHRKLGAMAAEGTFRLDLLHRLSVFLIQTPALCGRHEDIDALIEGMLEKLGLEEAPKRFGRLALQKLHAYSWPGNVRELQHTIERAWILAGDSSVIDETCVDFGEALL